MKTKKYFILAGYLLLILLIGMACINVDVNKEGILSASNVIGHPLHIAENQTIRGVSMGGEPSPWFVLTSGGNGIEFWSSIMNEQKSTLWPALNVNKFKNEGFVIVTGELNLHVKNITWAIIINKTN
jgi:hypothetical protein